MHDVVTVMDESLRPVACQVASALRKLGHVVDLILEPKKMKQVFKVTTFQHSLLYKSSWSCVLQTKQMHHLLTCIMFAHTYIQHLTNLLFSITGVIAQCWSMLFA